MFFFLLRTNWSDGIIKFVRQMIFVISFYGSFYLTDKFDYFVSSIIYLTDKLDVYKASDLSVKCLKASILSVIYMHLALKSIGFVR